MEQQVFTKFNLYDQIGYLMVGSIAAIIIALDAEFFYGSQIPDLDINNFIIWFVFVYFLGHLVQALANLMNKIPLLNFLIKEDKGEFSDDQKEILKEAKKFFKLESQNKNMIWNVCYLYSLSKDATGQIQAFNAYYSMYRGWLVIFFLESLFLLYYNLIIFSNAVNLSFLLLSIFLTFIFIQRSRRFWAYLTNKVLQTFVVIRN